LQSFFKKKKRKFLGHIEIFFILWYSKFPLVRAF
jgi:uncharacterized membrane protein (DUF485 family)